MSFRVSAMVAIPGPWPFHLRAASIRDPIRPVGTSKPRIRPSSPLDRGGRGPRVTRPGRGRVRT